MHRRLPLIALASLGLAACGDLTGIADRPSTSELQLATTFSTMADSIGQHRGLPPGGPMGFFLDTLRTTDNPAAIRLRERSRSYADSAHAARMAGDDAAARRYHDLAQETLFDAIAILLPNAYERASAVVDTIVARIEARLATEDAPRLERLLARVQALQDSAAAAAATDEGHALLLTMRALDTLHHLRERMGPPGEPTGGGDMPMDPDGHMGPGGGMHP